MNRTNPPADPPRPLQLAAIKPPDPTRHEPYRPEREDRGPRRDHAERGADRPAFEERGPRLGDAAFRAQREAFEAANMALKKLAMQAHGEVLTHLITAWEKRDAAQIPAAPELGKQVNAATRALWDGRDAQIAPRHPIRHMV